MSDYTIRSIWYSVAEMTQIARNETTDEWVVMSM